MRLSEKKKTENCFPSKLPKEDICADICLLWAIYGGCGLQTKSYGTYEKIANTVACIDESMKWQEY